MNRLSRIPKIVSMDNRGGMLKDLEQFRLSEVDMLNKGRQKSCVITVYISKELFPGKP